MEKDRLRQFYFSTSSSFGAYKSMEERKTKRRGESPGRSGTEDHAASLSAIDVSMPSTINDDVNQEQDAKNTSPTASVPTELRAMGGAVNAVRATAVKKSTAAELPSAASPGYYQFLKQQQELQKAHNRLESTTGGMASERRAKQAELLKLRRESRELLREIEESSNWSLHSKYDVQQLIRDSTLSLQPVELVDEKPAQLAALQQLARQLEQLKSTRHQTMQFAPHALLVEQGLRRLSLLEKTLGEGNMDFTVVSRIPDTLLVQLGNVCELSTVDALIAKFEEAIDMSTFQTEEARKRRETAVADGEVHVAEKMCYDILKHHEDMLEQIIAKVHVFEEALKENTVLAQVNEQYQTKAAEEFERLRVKMGKLRARCEADLAKMFSLRSKVEEVEAQTVKKVQEERDRSDALLQKNTERLDAVFVKLEELEREAESLERERHQLVHKRLQEKEKDEHRKTEYAQFCAVVDGHTKPLERTIRNGDLTNHASDILQEFVTNGFTSIRDDLKERGKILRDVKLETHKQHVEAMRGLMVELGDVVYRKERMIEETDKNIQQAHVQQELLAETFNPNAKKFGTVKKRLLLNRDELEADVKELKRRAEEALQQFGLSEEALADADVPFVHPVTEQQHHALALRTRMMEFKAVIAGQTRNQPMLQELEALKAEVADSQAELDAVNASTSGTMNKSLPMIRAAMKSRQSQPPK